MILILVDDVTIQEIDSKIWILKLLNNWVSFKFVLQVHHLVVTNQICVLIWCLDETVSVFYEVRQGLLAALVLQLHHTQVGRHETIAITLITERLSDKLPTIFSIYKDNFLRWHVLPSYIDCHYILWYIIESLDLWHLIILWFWGQKFLYQPPNFVKHIAILNLPIILLFINDLETAIIKVDHISGYFVEQGLEGFILRFECL